MIKTYTLILTALLISSVGCNLNQAKNKSKYETVASDPTRNTQLAKNINAIAVELLEQGNFEDAEVQLKDALVADVMFGPAHNNLGHVYYKQKKYYLAAWEFQYAAKLMPNQAEPKNNLAMVLETTGKSDKAAKYYEEALKIQPDNPNITANLARHYIKQKQYSFRTRELLNEIILKDTRPDWTNWAKEQLALKKFSPQPK